MINTVFEKSKYRYIFYVIFLFFIILFLVINTSNSYAVTVLSDAEKQAILDGTLDITYDLFGAKGDGNSNDYKAIKAAHDYANDLYVKTGIMRTVYSCSSSNCSAKRYNLGSSQGNGPISVVTNVDWRKANFVVDDFVDTNSDGVNEVSVTDSLFAVISPLSVFSEGSLNYLSFDSSFLTELSNNDVINSNITNLSVLIDALYNGRVNKSDFYNSNINLINKYFNSSQRWALEITNSNKMFIRKGVNENQGSDQSEIIIIDSKTGDVLTEINWNYDDITRIRIWPISDNKISVGNGSFTTHTFNEVYYSDSDGNAVKNSYVQRNIYVSFSGNVELHDINHYLNENTHAYTNKYQNVSNGNYYYGFVRLYNSAYVEMNDIYLVPHTPARIVSNNIIGSGSNGTYDLIIDNSVNVFIDNMNYSCNIYNTDGTTLNWNTCYKNNIINEEKWGIMGSNSTKNLFITNSKLNRIDAHRGTRNLHVADTTIGVGNGLKSMTLIGNGYFYGENLKIDSANHLLDLRSDYGATWDGTIVLNNIDFIVNKDSTNPAVVYAINDENWNFGYNSYFPNLYINGLNIDTTTKGASNVSYVTFLQLSNLFSNGNSTIDRSNSRNLYYFKDNIYLNNLTTNGNNFKLFTYSFPNSSTDVLNVNSYGGNNVVNVYLDSDVEVNSKITSHNFPKFNVVNSMNNVSSDVADYFDNLKNTSKMPAANKPLVGNIKLSSGSINEEIENDRFDYTADFVFEEGDSTVVTIDLEPLYVGTNLSWTSKTVDLGNGNDTINFSVSNPAGQTTNYTLSFSVVFQKDEIIELPEILKFNSGILVDNNSNYLKLENFDINVSNMLEKIETNGEISVFDKFGSLISDNSLITTGCLVNIKFSSSTNSYSIIVSGDVNGDGTLSVLDIVKINNHLIDSDKILTGLYYTAADYNTDSELSVLDIVKINNMLLK